MLEYPANGGDPPIGDRPVSQLLTEAEAAAILHLSARTLRGIRSRGLIRYVRPSPRRVFYRLIDIEEYIERNTFQDRPRQPTTNSRKARSGISTSAPKFSAITEALAARPHGLPKGLEDLSKRK